MRKTTIRLLALLALCMAVVFSSSVTAFAYAEDTEQDLPVTEATQPEETPKPDPEPEEVPETITPGEPIDDKTMCGAWPVISHLRSLPEKWLLVLPQCQRC